MTYPDISLHSFCARISGAARPRVRLAACLAAALAAWCGAASLPAGETLPASAPAGSVPSALIELDGSESYNPEGRDLQFDWRQLEGPRVVLSDPRAAKPYFRTSQPGYYVFELVVTAGGMRSDPFVLDFEIEMMNQPPVAVLPEEVRGEAGRPVEIDGRESYDPEGAALTYRWRPLTRGLDIHPSALNRPVLVFEPHLDGVFEVELVVSDGETVSRPAVTRVVVRPKPKPPVARARINTLDIPAAPQPFQAMAPPAGARPVAVLKGPAVTHAGAPVLLDARGSRGPGDGKLEYLWKQKSGPFISDFSLVFNGAAQRFEPPRVGDYEFELVVSDGKTDSEPVFHRLKVVGEAQPPVAVVNYPARSMPGALVRMDASQSYDMEGSELDFRWRQTGGPAVRNYVIDENLGKKAPAFYPPVAGVYSFEVIVDNGKMRSKPFEIHIEVGDARRPPALSIKGLEVAHTGDRVSLGAVCEDAADRRLSFVWRQVEGPAAALPETRGTHTEITPPMPGRYVIDLTALENGKEIATARRTLEVFDRPGSGGRVSGLAETLRDDPPQPERDASPAPSAVPQLTPLAAGGTVPGAGAALPSLPPSGEFPAARRPAAQIHPATRGGAAYGAESQANPLAPIAPITAP